MDKLEIKQGSFIQQTQYIIPVEIDFFHYMTGKIWADFAKDWHKIGILQWKINEDWHFYH
jgi:hypothetical protein